MKAVVRRKYGDIASVIIEKLEKPTPKPDEVVIKVMYTSVNRTDCSMVTGSPLVFRLFIGILKPKRIILGSDFAGVVEEVGSEVSNYKVGDRVFGFHDEGIESQAEYVALSNAKPMNKIPNDFEYNLAAASLEGVHYAVNFINKIKLKQNDNILVYGATGAIGTALVQICKYYGANVTAVSNTKNVELLKSIGADDVIDYETEDFTKTATKYKAAFDAVGKSSYAECKPLLLPKGVYISSELGKGAENIWLSVVSPIISLVQPNHKKVLFPFPLDIKKSIEFISKLIKEKKFTPVIEKEYAIEDASEAFKYVNSGQKTGNVLLKIQA